jgi:membrane protease subunit (stomatin/prohibitin family)
MTRKEEVENNNKVLSEEIKKCAGLEVTQEQVTNITLSAIAQELADINITLAMIVDQLTSTNGSGTAESEG